MMPRKQFESWLRSQILLVTDDGPCKKIILRHVTSASRMGSVVLPIDVPVESSDVDTVSDIWIEETCRLIETTAQADADGAGGMNSYIIQSYHGTKPDKPTARFTIKMHGNTDLETDDVSGEPPNRTGLLSQLMRHNEATMRVASITMANALSTIQRTQSRQEQMIEKLITEKFENYSLIENLLSQKNERDMVQAKAVQEMEMKEKVVDKLMLMAPTVINRFMASKDGQRALPEQTTPMEQQLASLADTMSMEQVEKLQQVFTPEQIMVFLDVMSNIKKKQDSLTSHNEEPKK